MKPSDFPEDDPDYFEDEGDPNLVPLQGSPEASSGTAEVSDLLMDVLCAATKLKWLIKELTQPEHTIIQERLGALKGLVKSIPDEGRPGKKVGFKGRKPRDG